MYHLCLTTVNYYWYVLLSYQQVNINLLTPVQCTVVNISPMMSLVNETFVNRLVTHYHPPLL